MKIEKACAGSDTSKGQATVDDGGSSISSDEVTDCLSVQSTASSTTSAAIEASTPSEINIAADSSDDEDAQQLEEQWSTPMEDEQMSEACTVCAHPSRPVLEEAMNNLEPIPAIARRQTEQPMHVHCTRNRGNGLAGCNFASTMMKGCNSAAHSAPHCRQKMQSWALRRALGTFKSVQKCLLL